MVQRHVLYLGEINDAQRAAWWRSIAVFDEDAGAATPLALFPEDRQAPLRPTRPLYLRHACSAIFVSRPLGQLG